MPENQQAAAAAASQSKSKHGHAASQAAPAPRKVRFNVGACGSIRVYVLFPLFAIRMRM